MSLENIVLELAIIFAGASILATIFLFLKQPVILSYITLGALIGPWGFSLISDAKSIEHLAHFGVILLLFLLGLHLQPMKLVKLIKTTSIITVVSSLIFVAVVAIILILFGFGYEESLISSGALMFSSTVISLKLIPTNTLHHRRKGELMTSILLFQDILAIIMILMLGLKSGSNLGIYAFLLLKLVLLIVTAFLAVKYVILPLFLKFDIIQEYIFLVSLGWCLLYSELANHLSISYEMGAFIAGLSLASSPVAWNIAEKLKPLQEFFIILFFFSIGANFDISVTKSVLVPGIIVAVVILIIKPLVFKMSFSKIGENSENSKELGLRLGQASEFSLLLISSALYVNKVTPQAVYLVNLATIITFIFSTYLVVKKYPTPITPK